MSHSKATHGYSYLWPTAISILIAGVVCGLIALDPPRFGPTSKISGFWEVAGFWGGYAFSAAILLLCAAGCLHNCRTAPHPDPEIIRRFGDDGAEGPLAQLGLGASIFVLILMSFLMTRWFCLATP